jgi:hypothetical protein
MVSGVRLYGKEGESREEREKVEGEWGGGGKKMAISD